MDTFPQGFFEHAIALLVVYVVVVFPVAVLVGRWLRRTSEDYPDWLDAERADSDARAFAVPPAAEVTDDWNGRL